MRKKTKLTDQVKKYVLDHFKVETIEKMSKDLNFDTKALRGYVEEVQKLASQNSDKPEESKAVQKQKKHVTVMTKGKSQQVDDSHGVVIKDDQVTINDKSEIKIDPERVFVRPN